MLYGLGAFSIASSTGIVVLNRVLMTTYKCNSLLLLWLHLLCGSATSWALLQRRAPGARRCDVSPRWMVLNGGLTLVAIGLQNMSLQLNDMATYQLLKLLATPLAALREDALIVLAGFTLHPGTRASDDTSLPRA